MEESAKLEGEGGRMGNLAWGGIIPGPSHVYNIIIVFRLVFTAISCLTVLWNDMYVYVILVVPAQYYVMEVITLHLSVHL